MSFEEWLAGITSFENMKDIWSSSPDLHILPPRTVARYLRTLLTEAPRLLQDIPPNRLSNLIWFFNGACSEYWRHVRKPEVPQEEQIQTVRALGHFYKDFLDHYPLGSTPDESEAETAVYMMWDMDCLEGAAMFPGEEHLIEPIFEVLGIALRCRSFGCQRSALHGLGHLAGFHMERVQREIDSAIAQPGHLHKDLVDYALDAREGNVL